MRSLVYSKLTSGCAGWVGNIARSLLRFGLFWSFGESVRCRDWRLGKYDSKGETRLSVGSILLRANSSLAFISVAGCLCCWRRAGNCPRTRPQLTHTQTHDLSHITVPQKHSLPSLTSYLAFSGLGWPTPNETLINNPQVLLPVVHFEAVDMRAACRTHGSHSIRFYCPLGDQTCSNLSTQTQSKWVGRLACQVRCPPMSALRLTGHVLIAVTETRAVPSIKKNVS